MAEKCLNKYDASDFITSQNKEDFLGCGSYAAARKCCHKKHRRDVVVKCFNIQGSKDEQDRAMEGFIREMKVLSRLSHKNIVCIDGITRWGNCVGIVMEFVRGKSLEDLLKSRKVPNISWELRLRFYKEMADALAYLHYADDRKKFIHGDFKPQNILLTIKLMIKIADFGSTHIVKATGASKMSVDVAKTSQHTPFYSAPEVLKDPYLEREPSMDVYSFSMIGYEIITRQTVFAAEGVVPDIIIMRLTSKDGLSPNERHIDVVEKSLKNQPENLRIFHLLKSIMMRCWSREPHRRPDIREVSDILNEQFDLVNRKDVEKAVTDIASQMHGRAECESSATKVELKTFRYPFEEAHSSSSTCSSVTVTLDNLFNSLNKDEMEEASEQASSSDEQDLDSYEDHGQDGYDEDPGQDEYDEDPLDLHWISNSRQRDRDEGYGLKLFMYCR